MAADGMKPEAPYLFGFAQATCSWKPAYKNNLAKGQLPHMEAIFTIPADTCTAAHFFCFLFFFSFFYCAMPRKIQIFTQPKHATGNENLHSAL